MSFHARKDSHPQTNTAATTSITPRHYTGTAVDKCRNPHCAHADYCNVVQIYAPPLGRSAPATMSPLHYYTKLPPIASPDVALSRRRGDDFRNPPGKRHSVSSASRAISPLTPTPQPTWHYISTAAYNPAPAGVKRNPCSLTSIREH